MPDAFHNSSTILGVKEEEIVVGRILLGHGLDDLLGQHSANDGAHWTQLPVHHAGGGQGKVCREFVPQNKVCLNIETKCIFIDTKETT